MENGESNGFDGPRGSYELNDASLRHGGLLLALSENH